MEIRHLDFIACRCMHYGLPWHWPPHVALEGNKDIFNAILKPMRKSPVVTPTVAAVVEASEDPDDMPVVPRKFIRKGKFSK